MRLSRRFPTIAFPSLWALRPATGPARKTPVFRLHHQGPLSRASFAVALQPSRAVPTSFVISVHHAALRTKAVNALK